MRRIACLIALVSCLVSCKKEPYNGIVVRTYTLSDSIFTHAGYYIDSNQHYVPFSNSDTFHTSFNETVGVNRKDGFDYCLIRTDTFWWRDDLKLYGKASPKNFKGDYVSVKLSGDSIYIDANYQSMQTWNDTYRLLGVKQP